jgi:hypothetical protein
MSFRRAGSEPGAILLLAEGACVAGSQNGKRLGISAEALVLWMEMDAGTRDRRCQYVTISI